jgi:hypothetical protein
MTTAIIYSNSRYVTTMHGTSIRQLADGLYVNDSSPYRYETAIAAIRAHVCYSEVIKLQNKITALLNEAHSLEVGA